MEFIHKNIVNQIKSYNVYAQKEYFREFKELNPEIGYHPIISILHKVASSLSQVEYSVSSDPIKETQNYYKMKVSLSDYTLLPNDISKVLNHSNHSKNQRARAYLSNKLEVLILDLEAQRNVALTQEQDQYTELDLE
jgi:hypothetical protein